MSTIRKERLTLTRTEVGITTLTLDDPDTRNSLSIGMTAELSETLREIAADANTRVLVLAAEGKVFCSGHNLGEIRARFGNHDAQLAVFRQCSDLMQQIVHLPQPVIAKVHGVATAAGCQLVASCDLAIAAENARFATPGVNIGLFCSTPMVALSRNVSRKHAMEMLLTGKMISAARAEQVGLVNRVVPETELHAAVDEMALAIAAKSQATLRIGKTAFYRQVDMPLAEAYDYTAEVMMENLKARDAQEGIGAFLDKREASWQDQ